MSLRRRLLTDTMPLALSVAADTRVHEVPWPHHVDGLPIAVGRERLATARGGLLEVRVARIAAVTSGRLVASGLAAGGLTGSDLTTLAVLGLGLGTAQNQAEHCCQNGHTEQFSTHDTDSL